jgi:Carboxypeptidase regulatory-like domain
MKGVRQMRGSNKFVAVLLAALVGGSANYAIPQSRNKATLSGVVVGPDGKPVANAVVTYQSGGGDTPHAVHTDAKGRFTIVKLRRDNYDLRASSHGLNSTWLKNVMVRSGQQKTLTLQLTNGTDLSKTRMKTPQ